MKLSNIYYQRIHFMVCEVYDNDNDNNRSPLLDLVIQVHKGALEYEPSGQNRI